jgi:DNA-binding NtrC family response regulator
MAAEAVNRTLVGQTVAEVEQQLILDTLSHCSGNRTHAAMIARPAEAMVKAQPGA